MSIVSCCEAAFSYEGSVVAHGLDFRLAEGDYLCIVGENGSGKSTLIKGLLGLKQPSSGSISYGEGVSARSIGYLPQQNELQRTFPASVEEVVLSGRLANRGARPFYSALDRRIVDETLIRLGIGDLKRYSFGQLSGGQQQRVLLARALCTAPDTMKLLILDEPMSGLDPLIKQELYSLIESLNKQGITIIVVTHDVQTAITYATHILHLEQRQVFFGSAHEFQHTKAGQELIRDSCGGHCLVCGLAAQHG